MALTEKEKQEVKKIVTELNQLEKKFNTIKKEIETMTSKKLNYNKLIHAERGKIKTIETTVNNKLKNIDSSIRECNINIKDCYKRIDYAENLKYKTPADKKAKIKIFENKIIINEKKIKELEGKKMEIKRKGNDDIRKVSYKEDTLTKEQNDLSKRIIKGNNLLKEINKKGKMMNQRLNVLKRKA